MPIPTSMNPFRSPFSITLFRLECIGKINYIAVVLLSQPIVCFIFSIQNNAQNVLSFFFLLSLQIELIEMAKID